VRSTLSPPLRVSGLALRLQQGLGLALMACGLLGLGQPAERWMALSLAPGIKPSWQAPFGANALGQDLFARWLEALAELWRSSVPGAAMAWLLALLLAVWASQRGWRGAFGRWLLDLGDSLPGLLVLLAGAVALAEVPGASALLFALALWPEVARSMAQQWRSGQEAMHVLAAQTLGVQGARLWWRHVLRPIWPLLLRQALVLWIMALKWGVLLGFLGIGQGGTCNLGNMLTQGLAAARLGAPAELLIAGISLSCLTFASLSALQYSERRTREWNA